MVAPLEGIRIIDWTQWQLGPVATAMMADLGATVIHVEDRVTGDAGRGLWNIDGYTDWMPGGRRPYFETNNRGKKSLTLDLVKQKGKDVLYRLVKNSHVFVHNMRQGVPEKLGLDYEALRQHNPNLLYVAGSGYGPNGPEAKEPSFNEVAMARSGIYSQIGEPGKMIEHAIGGGAIADQMGGIMTAYAILVGLMARERYGVGQKVDVSHLGAMIALQGLAVSRQLYLGEKAAEGRVSRKKASNPLWNRYPCQNEKWISLAMLQSDRYWPTMCRALSMEHLEKDPRFENQAKRKENCEELIAIMDEIFMTKSVTEWLKILREAGDIICTPVQTLADLASDPQVLANNYITDYNHEVLGPIKVVGLPVQLSETPGVVKAEAPEFGQHTEEVLLEIGGYTWEEIAQFREEEVI